MSRAEQGRLRASSQEEEAAHPRLLLIEPAGSAPAARIVRAAAQVEIAVELVRLPLGSLAPGRIVGVGPSVDDPLQVARDVCRGGRQTMLVFFLASKSSCDALHAALIRDPFLCERYALIEMTDDRRQLARRIAQVGARVERPRHQRSSAERALRRARGRSVAAPVDDRHIAAIVAQASDAVFSTDARGCLLTWNDAATRLLGHAAGAVIGQPLSTLDTGEGGELEQLGQAVLTTHEAAQASVTCQHADGHTIAVAVSVGPIYDDGGQLGGLSIIARDNAGQVRIEEALRDASRQKDEFLAIMSHELRTPLTSILGYTDMLLRGIGGQLEPRSSGFVVNVRSAGDRLLELVNGLLEYTRLEAGAERLVLRSLDLPQLVREVAERFREQAARNDIELAVDVAESRAAVSGDEDRLQHVLRCYLGNALKFTPGGGRVRVAFGRDPEHPDLARVSVSDSGIGLRADQLGHVWERFYQGDQSLTRRYGGMGLGLSIARHLIQLHGGHVGAESRGPGQGSTFWFSLPLSG